MATGRCCCGASSVTVSGPPQFSATCHCDDCRRRTGSALGWSAYFPDDQVSGPTGKLAEYCPEIDAPQVRWFCTSCGTTLAWRSGCRPGLTGVAAGTFIEDPLPAPSIANRWRECVDWLTLPVDWRHVG